MEEKELGKGISVIVPFHNAEETLEETLESLLTQKVALVPDLRTQLTTYPFEVLMIDNNSTDTSSNIAQVYARDFPNVFKYLTCETPGVSAARDYGMANASMEFITFLDADDTLSLTALRDSYQFFSTNKNKVDIVFIPRFFMSVDANGEKTYKPHHRNKVFGKTGIKEFSTNYNFTYTTPNVVIKNTGEHHFDETVHYGEDMMFISKLIGEVDRVGFVESAHYHYRFDAYSTVDKFQSPTKMADLLLINMTNQFAPYIEQGIDIPRQVQAIALNEVAWRYDSLSNKLFPYHLDEEAFNVWMMKFQKLLRHIDDDIILSYPSLDSFHRFSVLLLKNEPIKVAAFDDFVEFRKNGKRIHREEVFETVFTRFKVQQNKLHIEGYLKNKLGDLIQADVYARVNNEEIKLKTWQSVSSRYKIREVSNYFTAFRYNFDLSSVENETEIEFFYRVGEFDYPIQQIWTDNNLVLDINRRSIKAVATAEDMEPVALSTALYGDFKFELMQNLNYRIEKIDSADEINNIKKASNSELQALRELGLKISNENRNVWLYTDNFNTVDNGFYQYLNDYQKADGIDRYYVYKEDFLSFSKFLFNHPEIPANLNEMNLVRYGSYKHKELMVRTRYILAAYNEYYAAVQPFTAKELFELNDVLDFEYVYLQHGVLHAKAPQTYDAERTYIDKIVISSDYERDIFKNELHYEEQNLLQVGQARFDLPQSEKQVRQNILFAPSWRHNFVGDLNKFDLNGNRMIDRNKLQDSQYYQSLVTLMGSEDLNNYLETNDLTLDIKLHPIFSGVFDLLEPLIQNNSHINLLKEQVNATEYAIFVTDFSSYVFDAVYARQTIIYYELDRDEFLAGNHNYRELYLDYEFGPVVNNANDFIAEIDKARGNGFAVEQQYLDKMNAFYQFPEHSREALYQALVTSNGGNA